LKVADTKRKSAGRGALRRARNHGSLFSLEASERRHYDSKTSIRHMHLTVGALVDQPARSLRHFAKNERVR
jgi:hypothetical protein